MRRPGRLSQGLPDGAGEELRAADAPRSFLPVSLSRTTLPPLLAQRRERRYNQLMRMRWRAVAMLLAAGIISAACGLGHHEAPPPPHEHAPPPISADLLGEQDTGDTAWDALSPEEREAVRNSGLPRPFLDDPTEAGVSPELGEKKTGMAHVLDVMGKVGVAIATVGLTLAALVAPFFAF